MNSVSFGIGRVGLEARDPGTEVEPRLTKRVGLAGVNALKLERDGAKFGRLLSASVRSLAC